MPLGHTFTLKRLSFLIYRMSGDSRLGVHQLGFCSSYKYHDQNPCEGKGYLVSSSPSSSLLQEIRGGSQGRTLEAGADSEAVGDAAY